MDFLVVVLSCSLKHLGVNIIVYEITLSKRNMLALQNLSTMVIMDKYTLLNYCIYLQIENYRPCTC